YVDALKKEMEIYSQKIRDVEIISIYVGGGTPTVLTGEQLSEILSSCYHNFQIAKKVESTVEANPGTIDKEKMERLLQSGVNRISLGAQSFNNKALKKLGRIHTKEDNIAAYQLARSAGFKNINVDIMFGLPGQSKKEFENVLTELMLLKPEHISLYALSVESGTPLDNTIKTGKTRLPCDDFCNKLFLSASDYFSEYGYEHYEISNFAQSAKRCIHNELYWKNRAYLSIGAGATSYIDNKRYQNYQELNQYIYLLENGILPIRYQEVLPLKERMAETIILNLRMMEGLEKKAFHSLFNITVEDIYYQSLHNLKEQGLLTESNTHYFLTKKGILLANNVFMEFLD
ncbi:MAG TPA: radical SAM family heme chaperone HemW, partial [Atribacterota bacterium]|nr:radical SAM family heme chaperone HemW [Atribacterota bacterium]